MPLPKMDTVKTTQDVNMHTAHTSSVVMVGVGWRWWDSSPQIRIGSGPATIKQPCAKTFRNKATVLVETVVTLLTALQSSDQRNHRRGAWCNKAPAPWQVPWVVVCLRGNEITWKLRHVKPLLPLVSVNTGIVVYLPMVLKNWPWQQWIRDKDSNFKNHWSAYTHSNKSHV